ncbi:MAG: hypothetical protein DMG57_05745 [Acidobacteria bacterium]|nr:MAG: hypothetical protein DMG57_05745 [Acidobacteriota bacterium]
MIAIVVVWVLYMQRNAHIEPQGKILKVRTQAMDENSSVAVVDFRMVNSSDYPIWVREVVVSLQGADGNTYDGAVVSETDAKALFRYYPLLGQKYNDSLIVRDRIHAHQTVDKMIAARFEMPQGQLDARKKLTVHIEDVDGPSGDLVETK